MFDLLFETSWEVCNKVGGIYAVLSTKAKTLQQQHKDKVVFIGPDIWTKDNESPFFTESKSLLADWKEKVSFPAGMTVRVGRWNIPGKPIAILVDFKSLFQYKNELYAKMWDHYKVDSLHAYGDYDEACAFAYGSALVIESLVKFKKMEQQKVIAHFNEWTTGMGLLYVKSYLPGVATVFTTHATSIGRSICGNGKPLYDYMKGYNGDQMAGELNMESKHSLEKAAAQNADAFTTVSDVTARECEQLLERKPIVTPNGFELNFVPKGAKYAESREAARKRLLQAASALTGETYDDDTFLLATSGRCEFRNKGLDVGIDALNVVRYEINKLQKSKRKIIAFITVPGWTDAPRTDLVEAMEAEEKGTKLFDPIITHSIHNFDSDPIYGKLNYLGLRNEAFDKVKVIYVPSYLNGNDGVFNMSYYDLLIGFDLTIFPSYYEPWGYTPLESVAFAVPTITTDLAGFGQWVVNEQGNDARKSGVEVIHRTDSNYSPTVMQVAHGIMDVFSMKPAEWHKLSRAAQKTAKMALWSNFIKYYDTAYAQALDSASKRK
ncbi:MAG: glycogen/starch synthase [Bacteroidales bacterium]|nr:glycogen/starch synthase [Bacteroidales bacterium]